MTNPSRSASKGRLARSGSLFPVERAFMALNPPTPVTQMHDSVPAGDHGVGIAALDPLESVADGMGARGAGRNHADVGALGAKSASKYSPLPR